ncbi:hypothetical protein BDU57DRAFT_522912 [Ampelomyces quisqualis]|uniref:Uncharacterized protein n=1 Tax=Ampelomyces quisqualis TaxID=50730 RepID=A0A6A5QCG5_AMPQU|nr:hypothetical protein BDU57DRAFT_522912 [Ampelomyces quisqualis]
MLVRIFHYAPPDLSYDVQIRPFPLRNPKSTLRWTEHALADECNLFTFPNTTFSFNNFGPFRHFVEQHTPADVALMTKVQWEAHDDLDIAGGSTLTVAKKLVSLLPSLEEVTLRLVLEKNLREGEVSADHLAEWKAGLEGLKEGLKVVVKKNAPKEFEKCMRGGSVRFVPNPGKVGGESRWSKKMHQRNWVE